MDKYNLKPILQSKESLNEKWVVELLAEQEKLPEPSNEGLGKLFASVDRVVIKDLGIYETKAGAYKNLLTISEPDHIQTFHDLLEIDESKNAGLYWMSLGDYIIDLYAGIQLKASFSFFSASYIRYDKWYGDAALAKESDLVMFLADQGFTEPLHKYIKDKKRMEDDRIMYKEWLDIAPTTFTRYWDEIRQDNSVFATVVNDLNAEIPDKQQRIISLLQTFGQTDSFWTAFPSYEALPNKILLTFETEEIITAYLNSDRSHIIKRGLGRFLCFYTFKQKRKNELGFIPLEVIDELETCFTAIGENRGILEIENLRKEKLDGL